jgi:hypothetical protein
MPAIFRRALSRGIYHSEAPALADAIEQYALFGKVPIVQRCGIRAMPFDPHPSEVEEQFPLIVVGRG